MTRVRLLVVAFVVLVLVVAPPPAAGCTGIHYDLPFSAVSGSVVVARTVKVEAWDDGLHHARFTVHTLRHLAGERTPREFHVYGGECGGLWLEVGETLALAVGDWRHPGTDTTALWHVRKGRIYRGDHGPTGQLIGPEPPVTSLDAMAAWFQARMPETATPDVREDAPHVTSDGGPAFLALAAIAAAYAVVSFARRRGAAAGDPREPTQR